MRKSCSLFLLLVLFYACSPHSGEPDSDDNVEKKACCPTVDSGEKAEKTILSASDLPQSKQHDTKESVTKSSYMERDLKPFSKIHQRSLAGLQIATQQENLRSAQNDSIVFRQEAATFTSLNSYFIIDFENDIFANTDYYFTNGTQLSAVFPSLQHLFFSKWLPSAGKTAMNHYKLSIRQNMYTPVNPEATEINKNDRPFAGILLIEYMKISTLHNKALRITSCIQLGTIGKSSLAEAIQQNMHKFEPIGWKYQIQEDILINFGLMVEKAVLLNRHHELTFVSRVNFGSFLTEIEAGLHHKSGLLSGSFNPFPVTGKGTFEYVNPRNQFKIWLFVEGAVRYNLYNASLEGGLFNRQSPYTIEGDRRKRRIAQLATGVEMTYRRSALRLKLVYLSPEFKGGFDHRWGAISILQNLNN